MWDESDEVQHIEDDLRSNEMLEEHKQMNQRVLKSREEAIAVAVWEGEIDQMSTKEIATYYCLTQQEALRILKKIVAGQCDQRPFKLDDERGSGVIIADGSTFDYSPMDIDGGGISSNGRPKHYIWFCS